VVGRLGVDEGVGRRVTGVVVVVIGAEARADAVRTDRGRSSGPAARTRTLPAASTITMTTANAADEPTLVSSLCSRPDFVSMTMRRQKSLLSLSGAPAGVFALGVPVP